MACNKGHRYLADLTQLPDSQAGSGRHMCAGCAYEQGFDDGFDGNPNNFRVNEIDESQAGTGRHKDVESAYELGYSHGQAKATTI